MAILTADELNQLIFRYFTESGFMHTAFMFDSEAGIKKSPVYGNMIPHGALVTLLIKGLQYKDMEEKLKKGENVVDKDLSFQQVMMNTIKKDKEENGEQEIVIDQKNKQYLTRRAPKLDRQGKARKARESEEAGRKARESEEAGRKAREREEAGRKAREREEAERKARESEEAGRKTREKEEAERKAREREEARRKARESEEAGRKAREREEAGRKAREREEAGRKARERVEAERNARGRVEAERKAREKKEADRNVCRRCIDGGERYRWRKRRNVNMVLSDSEISS